MIEDVARKFEAAQKVFAMTCGGAVAPEATFQGWFAHYLISQFGIDRVAREPIFKHKDIGSKWQHVVPGGEVKLDAVVLRQPGVNLPHHVHRGGVKSQMPRMDPAFKEKSLGFTTFREFVESRTDQVVSQVGANGQLAVGLA